MDNETIFSLIAIGFLLVCSGFFSGSETGLTAVSRARIFKLAMEKNRRARLVYRLREQKESLIGAILLGNNLVNILASALATSVAIDLWGDAGVAYATLIMTLLVLIFAEVLPKTYAIQRSEKVALAVAPMLNIIVKLLSPITGVVKALIALILRMLGIDLQKQDSFVSVSDVLRGTIEMHHRQGDMAKHDRDMLGGILELEEIEVEEVMVHRKQVEAIDIEDSPADIVKQVVHSSHSRLPVFDGDYSKIVGVLHAKDLLRILGEEGWQAITIEKIIDLLSKPWFIPAKTTLKDQLYAFRQQRLHFALVVDEYGALQGIVTLEDVIEEIVGEIDDEYDTIDMTDIVELKPNVWVVSGGVGIRDLNRHLDWELPDDEANTIAGLILNEARDIPEPGERYQIQDVYFTVEQRTANQITRVKLEKRKVDKDLEDDTL